MQGKNRKGASPVCNGGKAMIECLPEEYKRMEEWMMRRLISMMLALTLLFGAFGGLAEEQNAGENRIPQPGEEICGFETKEIRDFPMGGGQLVLFEHQKTGAQVLWIANEDTNRAFQISFLTRPHDDMGLPHVFEHATLFGSEKYPSSNLFFNIAYQTYNTFINAYTADIVTAYPIASLSEKQLLSLADYYVDSCFHPLIMTDESIFRTQAWHYNLPEADGELTYEGVVYSEMTGAMTLERASMEYANDVTFPGASLSYSYGGVPEVIPEMTWEDVKSFHELYYHPSNSFTVLYGQLDNYAGFLNLLDTEFRNYEKKEYPREEPDYKRITESVTAKYPYPVAEGTNTANRSAIHYYLVLPGMKGQEDQERLMDHFCLMMNYQGSPLQQRIKNRFPAASVSCGREVAGPDDAVMFSASGMNEEDGEAFKALVDEAIRDAAENGFAGELADSVMTAQQMSARLTGESGDPVSTYMNGFMYNYAATGNPFEYQEGNDALERIGEENRSGAMKETAAAWLVGNPLYTLTTVYPAPGEKEKQEETLRAKLAEIKAGMTEEELQELVAETNAEAKVDDTREMMAKLKTVGVEELPEELRLYSVSDTTDEMGIRYVEAEADVDEIGQVKLRLDAAALPQEDLHWMGLFTRLLGELDTDAHTKEELDLLIGRYLFGKNFGVEALEMKDHTVHPYLYLEWIAMNDDLARGYELAEELIFHTSFADTAKLADLIKAQKTTVRGTISNSSMNVMLYRGLADRYPSYRYRDYLNHLEYYRFLEKLEQEIAENPAHVTSRLEEIQRFFANRAGAVASFAGDRKSMETNHALAKSFLSGLGSEPREPAVYDLPIPSGREALIVDGNIQYNNVIATMDDLGMEEFDYGLTAVCALVTDQILMPVLRDRMGVYTPLNNTIPDAGMYLITYRDPGVRETFQVYESLADQIAKLEVDQDTMDGYIMSTYSNLAKPQGELNGAVNAISLHLQGMDPDLKLKYMRQLKQVTPDTLKAAAEYYRLAWQNGAHTTSGSAGAINANADLYDVIQNPFGTQDATRMELKDLPEDHPAFGAIRFLFENGFMPAKEDGRILPDEEGTLGDLASALFAALGLGTADDPATAAATLAQYGLLPADASPEAPLTWGMYDQVMSGLAALSGQELPAVSTEENRDTSMTRGELAAAIAPIFGYGAEE